MDLAAGIFFENCRHMGKRGANCAPLNKCIDALTGTLIGAIGRLKGNRKTVGTAHPTPATLQEITAGE
jgi:hypothetical protein